MSAGGNGFTRSSFEFLEQLAENNDRTWFDAHRETFRERLDRPFEALLEEVSARLAGTDTPLRGGRATMFRINRDVRFSPDKSPYSLSVSGLLTASGTKSEAGGLVYVQCGIDGGMAAGGLHKPPTSRLGQVRQALLDDPDAFDEVLASLSRAGLELDPSDAVKSMPRGFSEAADHRHADSIRLKQLVASRDLPRSAWLDDTAADRIARFATDIGPLIRFVDRAS